MRTWIAVALTCGLLGGCSSWQEAFEGARTIDIWDERVVGRDDTRLSRHAVALSDAQPLVGLSRAGDSVLVFAWHQDGARPDKDGCGREAPPDACREPRWTYSLEMVSRPVDAPGAPAGPPPAITLVDDEDVVLVEPLSQGGYQRLVVEYVRDRVAQIDHLCLGYFSGLERLASGSNATRDGIGVVANYGSILLALSESATKPLAILAGTRAALDGSLTAAETLLLLNPAPMQTFRLVRASQTKALTEARVENFTRYTDAAAFIERYAYDCTPLGIRRIISETIDDEVRRIDPETTTAAGQVLLGQIVTAVNAGAKAGSVLKTAPLIDLSSADAAYLAILVDQWVCPEGEKCLSQEILYANAPASLRVLLREPRDGKPGEWELSAQTLNQLRQLLGALVIVQPSLDTLRAQTLTRISPAEPAQDGSVVQVQPAADGSGAGTGRAGGV